MYAHRSGQFVAVPDVTAGCITDGAGVLHGEGVGSLMGYQQFGRRTAGSKPRGRYIHARAFRMGLAVLTACCFSTTIAAADGGEHPSAAPNLPYGQHVTGGDPSVDTFGI